MISFFAVDKVQLINTVINRVFHNCVGRIKLYVMDRVNFIGHHRYGSKCIYTFLNFKINGIKKIIILL